MKRLPLILAFLLALQCTALADAPVPSLFDFLRGLDGKTYPGQMTYPADAAHEMNKPMSITVQVVSQDEIRIPLQVGKDRSRTWVLTRSGSAVALKHDHRHPDGSPDKVTNYGGVDSHPGLGVELVFPADEETQTLLPEAASNAWSLRISPDGKRLFYYLERHSKPRFEAAFDLATP